jgi:hypothetical protein
MSRFVVLASLLIVLTASPATRAQVIYEPVQYQYFSGGRAYYYGGANPHTHWRANLNSQDPGYGRTNGWAFVTGNVDTHREVGTEPIRAYSDAIPHWNGRVYGYTPNDARNAAYENAGTYFRKADLLKTSIRQEDGTWHVPAQPTAVRGTIEIRPYRAVTPVPATSPKPILIIPKRLLDKPLWGTQAPMADAR